MIIDEKTAGPKIPYEVIGTKIIFDDDLMLNLAKRQDDEPVHIFICYNRTKDLVIGYEHGWRYVAEIDIPEREYTEPESEDDPREPLPLDMDKVKLTLWAIEE
jgi:hypothetical protein